MSGGCHLFVLLMQMLRAVEPFTGVVGIVYLVI